jgi:hypothetical protein
VRYWTPNKNEKETNKPDIMVLHKALSAIEENTPIMHTNGSENSMDFND